MRSKTPLTFNPDAMTVSEVKAAVSALRSIMQEFEKHSADWERIGGVVAQYADAFEVK